MVKKLVVLLLSAWAIGGMTSRCQSFDVAIKASTASARYNVPFAVSTEVRNVSKSQQVIELSPCTYPSEWTSDNLRVRLVHNSCLQDALLIVKLKPGEAYKASVFVQISPSESAQDKSVTFRLGNRIKLSVGDLKPPTVSPLTWSKPVTIGI
jgi:hypothetical protein